VVSTAVDGHPQRVIITPFIYLLEKAGSVGRVIAALRHALAFKSLTGASMWSLFQEGLAMRRHQKLSWPEVLMAANAPMYTRGSLVDGKVDTGVLPTGQVVGNIQDLPTVAQLFEEILGEAEATLDRLSNPNTQPQQGDA
jgi:NAD(P)H-dependent flavin oxidoreductase YrpB (nitropropane dioxygenase family)